MPLSALPSAGMATAAEVNGASTTPTSSSRRLSDGEIVWPLPRERAAAVSTNGSLLGSAASGLLSPVNVSDDEGSEGSEVVWRVTPRPDKAGGHAISPHEGSDTGSGVTYTRKKQPSPRPLSAYSRDTAERSVTSSGGRGSDPRLRKRSRVKEGPSPTHKFTPTGVEGKAPALHMMDTPSYSSVTPSKSDFRPRGNSVLLSDEEREAFSTARLPLETADEQAERLREHLATSFDGLKVSKAASPSSSPTGAPHAPPPPPPFPHSPTPSPRDAPSVDVRRADVTVMGEPESAGSPALWDISVAQSARNATNIFADGAPSPASPADSEWPSTFIDQSNASPLPEEFLSSAEKRAAKQRRKEERAAKRAAKEARRLKREAERSAHHVGTAAPVAPATTGAWNVQSQVPPIVSSDAHTATAFNDAAVGRTPSLKLAQATPAAVTTQTSHGATPNATTTPTTSTQNRLEDGSPAFAEVVTGTACTTPTGAHGVSSAHSSTSPRIIPRNGLVMFQTTPDVPLAATRQTSLLLTEGSRSGFGAAPATAAEASKELHTRELEFGVGIAPDGEVASQSARRAANVRGGGGGARHATQPREALGKSQLKGYAPSHAKRRLKRRRHGHHQASEKAAAPVTDAHHRTPTSAPPQAPQRGAAANEQLGDEKEKAPRHRRHSRRHSHRRRHHSGKGGANDDDPAAPAAAAVAAAAVPLLASSGAAIEDASLKEPYSQPHPGHLAGNASRDASVNAPPRRCTSAAGPSSRTPVPPQQPRGAGERLKSRRFSAAANLSHATGSAPNVITAGYSGPQHTAPLYGVQSSRNPGRRTEGDDSSSTDARLKPTPPPAAAGSAAAAVHELKLQKELTTASGATGKQPGEQQSLRPPLREGSGSQDRVLIQQVESFSTASSRSDEHSAGQRQRGRVTTVPPRGAAGNDSKRVSPRPPVAERARSVESDYYTSYTNSHDSRRDRRSSCSSFGSYTSDPRSDSSYSDSSYTYSSGSSDSELLCEKIPPRPGCRTSPPLLLFTDLQHRHMMAQRMDLRRYAETGVIYEWNISDGCWDRVETQVIVASEPFSHGNMRASYFMIDLQRLDCKLVAKRYLKSSVEDNQYFDDVSMHSISGHWARLFNASKPPKEVRFVPAAVLELTERDPPLLLAMEPQLEGTFTKYNNNSGYVPKNARWTPQAFSHFTYYMSNHELLIVDIQGVGDIYTDPQILSPDGEGYGRGNLGLKGIRRFLSTHKCNSVCAALKLPPIQHRREAHGSESRTEKSDYVLPENLAREQLPPKIYKSTDVQRTRSMNNSQAGDVGRSATTPALSPPVKVPPGSGAVNVAMQAAPPPGAAQSSANTAIHDPRFMQHIRNAVSRPKANYFAPAAGMLPVTPASSAYPPESSSGKVKSGNSTALIAGSDMNSHSAMASSANVGAPLTQPAQPQRPSAPPVVMPYLRPLVGVNSSQSQNNGNLVNAGYQYSPRPGNWMVPTSGGGGYSYAQPAKPGNETGPDSPVPVLSAVEERRPGQGGRFLGMHR